MTVTVIVTLTDDWHGDASPSDCCCYFCHCCGNSQS